MEIVKSIKDFEKVVFVSRFNPNFVKKVMYFLAIFLYVEIKVFVGFFLNKESMNFLIIFLNIVLRMSE